jgi:histone acetyltransferase HTATIP
MSANTMPPSPRTSTEDPQPLTWLLQSFVFGKGQKITGATSLFLDRANAEFGFIRYSAYDAAAFPRYPETDSGKNFGAEEARAAAWREKCKKVCVLFQHGQLDLEFASPDLARSFLDMLGDIMMAAGNQFYTYEVPPKVAFMKADFDMEQQGFTSRATQPWIAVQNELSEWPRLRKTGEWSDFTIFAGGSQFLDHRVKICKESNYFKAVCSGGFRETAQQSIVLPESARIIATLLDEMYGVYNPTTGSIFTNFVPRKEIEKEHILNELLDLFIAADKVCHFIFVLFWPRH